MDWNNASHWITSEVLNSVKYENSDVLPNSLRVFVCYSHDDKIKVKEFVTQLNSLPIDYWLDDQKLLPGQDWKMEITKAIRLSDAVLVFDRENPADVRVIFVPRILERPLVDDRRVGTHPVAEAAELAGADR